TGVLVVNVTWRGKTYVGTLLDCTRHDWAPPRFCDSPTSDPEVRTPKGRGKRGRAPNTPVNVDGSSAPETRSAAQSKLRSGKGRPRGGGTSGGAFAPPPSPAKSETSGYSGKRKGRSSNSTGNHSSGNHSSSDYANDLGAASPDSKKRSRSSSRSTPTPTEGPPGSPTLIECPEPNCGKKYKHINGL
ncbi:unnamed protein product, partial [Darwinula stevensoni]